MLTAGAELEAAAFFLLGWTRRAVRPLWELPSRVPKIGKKSKKFEKNGYLKMGLFFLKGRFFRGTF